MTGNMQGQWHRRWLAAPGLAIAVLLAGCGGDPTEGGPASTSPSVSASPSEDAATAAAKKQVIAAYEGMVREQVEAYSKGSLKGSDIEQYAWDQALKSVKEGLLFNVQNGIVTKGEPKIEVKTTTVNLKASPQTGTLTVCFDNATWKSYNKKSGKDVTAPNQQKRYIVTSTLRTVGKRWVVIDGNAERDRKC